MPRSSLPQAAADIGLRHRKGSSRPSIDEATSRKQIVTASKYNLAFLATLTAATAAACSISSAAPVPRISVPNVVSMQAPPIAPHGGFPLQGPNVHPNGGGGGSGMPVNGNGQDTIINSGSITVPSGFHRDGAFGGHRHR
jgi:hypothetical protein